MTTTATKPATHTDAELILKCHPSVRPRRKIELQIVKATIKHLMALGYGLSELEDADSHAYNERELITHLMDLDDAFLCVHDIGTPYSEVEPAIIGHPTMDCIGWIRFVFGNDGYDVICDYTTNLETDIDPINQLADTIANGLD